MTPREEYLHRQSDAFFKKDFNSTSFLKFCQILTRGVTLNGSHHRFSSRVLNFGYETTASVIIEFLVEPLPHSIPDLSRRHHLHSFLTNQGVDAKIFEERLFILTT
jgi:hypothetical protein